MIRSMPHKQSSNTAYPRAALPNYPPQHMPHIVKRAGRWACWTTPGDHSMSARLARDWVRLANFKLENAP